MPKVFRQDQEAITILKVNKLGLIEVIHLSKQYRLEYFIVKFYIKTRILNFLIYLLKNSGRHTLMYAVYFEMHLKNKWIDGRICDKTSVSKMSMAESR